jgi:hypothetical protein
LILFEGGGTTVADELVLLLFELGLAVDPLLETNEVGLLPGIVADHAVGLLDWFDLNKLAGHPSLHWQWLDTRVLDCVLN